MIWIALAVGVAVPVAVLPRSDWAGGVSGGIILLAGIGVLTWVAKQDRERKRERHARRARLDAQGKVVTACIVDATQPSTGLVGVGDKHVVRIRVKATLEEGSDRELDLACLADPMELPRLQPGCSVQLRYHPSDADNCEVTLPPFERNPALARIG